jgi:hypothetical protein
LAGSNANHAIGSDLCCRANALCSGGIVGNNGNAQQQRRKRDCAKNSSLDFHNISFEAL